MLWYTSEMDQDMWCWGAASEVWWSSWRLKLCSPSDINLPVWVPDIRQNHRLRARPSVV